MQKKSNCKNNFLGNKHWEYVNGQLFFYKDERDSKENGK